MTPLVWKEAEKCLQHLYQDQSTRVKVATIPRYLGLISWAVTIDGSCNHLVLCQVCPLSPILSPNNIDPILRNADPWVYYVRTAQVKGLILLILHTGILTQRQNTS